MHSTHPRKIQFHRTSNRREPFPEWLESIRDRRTQTRIRKRLDQLEGGNFGDCQSVGDGVYELRLHFGAGYRIYFGEIDNTIILLLCGGDKSSQTQDIEQAKIYWLEYKEVYQ